MMNRIFYLTVLFGLFSFASLSYASTTAALDQDIERYISTRHYLDYILNYVHVDDGLFPKHKADDKRVTTREQRLKIWNTWMSFLERILLLDELGRTHENLYRELDSDQRYSSFKLSYAAFLMQYRYALDFIKVMENDPTMHVLLNEPVRELGLEKGSYSTLKFRFLNALRSAEFIRLNILYQRYQDNGRDLLAEYIEQDRAAIWNVGDHEGPKQTFRNAVQIIEDTGFTAWFPLQKTVSEWMGDVKVFRINTELISDAQIKAMQAVLEPGDILLERREWYLSNVGLPGYWPHAALYIGTAEERAHYFDDAELDETFNNDINAYLSRTFPAAYRKSTKKHEDGHQPRVIEAISEGVSFTTLEHSVAADSVAILRPRLSKQEKAVAIARAFKYSGRPYDFNFDFITDSALVCTELVYKAYEPAADYTGVTFDLEDIMGRKVTTANGIAKMFDAQYDTDDQQLEFIAFFDGFERKQMAIESDIETFRRSWKRPKWYIWVQGTALEGALLGE